jgi:methionyl-tRNA synthetase
MKKHYLLEKAIFLFKMNFSNTQIMKKKFFITTPIYYSNGIPHIGHAYSSLIADTIAKSKRLDGLEVKFCT